MAQFSGCFLGCVACRPCSLQSMTSAWNASHRRHGMSSSLVSHVILPSSPSRFFFVSSFCFVFFFLPRSQQMILDWQKNRQVIPEEPQVLAQRHDLPLSSLVEATKVPSCAKRSRWSHGWIGQTMSNMLGNLWNVYGMFMECLWNVYGMFLVIRDTLMIFDVLCPTLVRPFSHARLMRGFWRLALLCPVIELFKVSFGCSNRNTASMPPPNIQVCLMLGYTTNINEFQDQSDCISTMLKGKMIDHQIWGVVSIHRVRLYSSSVFARPGSMDQSRKIRVCFPVSSFVPDDFGCPDEIYPIGFLTPTFR